MDITIRPVRTEDAEAINELRRMPGVFENIMGIPSERLQRNIDGINSLGPNDHNFVAVYRTPSGEEKVVGEAGLHVEVNNRLRHSGGIGMMVHKDYQGQGIGSKLLEALLDVADNWLMLVRVELEVFTDNERAIGLYKKYGFEIEGTKRKATIRNGVYEDNYMMARLSG